MIERDRKQTWEVLGIHPDRMRSHLLVRRKSLKRFSRWFLIAGVCLAVQTTYSLDAGRNLVVRQATIEKASAHATHTVKLYTATFVFLTSTGSNVWTVPNDWNDNDNKIECIGGGGGSGGCANSGNSAGGGGGAYSAITNVNLTPGANVNYSVGVAGSAGINQNADGGNGGDTWFSSDTVLLAKGGSRSVHQNNSVPSSGANGGSSSSGVGTVKRSGGTSGACGGGAGGPNGSGNNGSGTAGGSGDAGHGGAGGVSGSASTHNGRPGTEMGGGTVGSGGGGYINGDGGLYGGGAGGAKGVGSGFWVAGNAGAKGIIVITYTPLVPPTITSISPTTGFTTGGDTITFTGTDFTGATAVKFGTTSATDVVVVSSTQITCTNPAHDSGTVDVSVTTAAGTGTKSNAFNYQDTPEPAGVPYIYGI